MGSDGFGGFGGRGAGLGIARFPLSGDWRSGVGALLPALGLLAGAVLVSAALPLDVGLLVTLVGLAVAGVGAAVAGLVAPSVLSLLSGLSASSCHVLPPSGLSSGLRSCGVPARRGGSTTRRAGTFVRAPGGRPPAAVAPRRTREGS